MKTGDSPTIRTDAHRPAVDEWGIYDPSQAGLSALFDKLETTPSSGLFDAIQVAASMQEANRLAEEKKKK